MCRKADIMFWGRLNLFEDKEYYFNYFTEVYSFLGKNRLEALKQYFEHMKLFECKAVYDFLQVLEHITNLPSE